MQSDFLMKHQDERGEFLACKIGPLQGKIAARFTAMSHQKGLVLSPSADTQPRHWEVKGFTDQKGTVYVLGDYIEADCTLWESLQRNPEATRPLVRDFLQALKNQGTLMELFSKDVLFLHGVICLKDGNFLILPKSVQDMCQSIMPMEQRFLVLDSYRHSGLKGKESILFGLWALSYQACFSTLPFDLGSSKDDYTRYLLKGLVKDPLALGFQVSSQIGDNFQRALGNPASGFLAGSGLDGLLALMKDYPDSTEIPSPQTRQKAEKAYSRKKKNADFVFRLRNNSSKILLAALVGLVVLAIPVTILISQLSPPKTAGMTAHEVVETYFKAMTNQDSALMEDCYAPGAGEKMINQITNVEIIRKIRFANEKHEAALDPQDWESRGCPPIDSSYILFGPGKFTIKELKNHGGMADFEVSYTFYSNLESTSEERGLHDTPVAKVEHRDRISLLFSEQRKVWQITGVTALK